MSETILFSDFLHCKDRVFIKSHQKITSNCGMQSPGTPNLQNPIKQYNRNILIEKISMHTNLQCDFSRKISINDADSRKEEL